ncbi:MAG: hypothetical protein R6V29_06405 [Spirochaetia bacterium]
MNVGCVPSKTLIRAAEDHHRAAHPGFEGIETHSHVAVFQKVVDQKREWAGARISRHGRGYGNAPRRASFPRGITDEQLMPSAHKGVVEG